MSEVQSCPFRAVQFDIEIVEIGLGVQQVRVDGLAQRSGRGLEERAVVMLPENARHVRNRLQRRVAFRVHFGRRAGQTVVPDDVAPADDSPIRRSVGVAPDQALLVAL